MQDDKDDSYYNYISCSKIPEPQSVKFPNDFSTINSAKILHNLLQFKQYSDGIQSPDEIEEKPMMKSYIELKNQHGSELSNTTSVRDSVIKNIDFDNDEDSKFELGRMISSHTDSCKLLF
jgi:hypothetical protein